MYSYGRRYRSTSHLPSASDNVNNVDGDLSSPLPSYREAIDNSFLSPGQDSTLLVNVDISRSFDDVIKKRTRGRDPNQKENRMPKYSDGRHNTHSLGSHRYSSMLELPTKSDTDSYTLYGNKQHSPERSKWLAYAKNIRPRKSKDSNLTKTASMDNIDVIDKYPSLQHSDFYQRLHTKYPQAFHRRLPKESARRRPRRLFNSGLRVHFEDEVSGNDDNRSICSERPVSQYEREIRERLGHTRSNGFDHWDRECRTSPTPSMSSDLSVKERLDATSERLHKLLYDSSPFRGRSRYKGYNHDLETLATPRGNKQRSRNSRTSSFSSDISVVNNSNVLTTPQNLDMDSDSNSHNLSTSDAFSLSQDEKIKALQRELELKDKELQSYRRKLDFDQRQRYSKNTHQQFEMSQWGMFSPESPPDSAIDVDSASVQSLVSADKFALSNDGLLDESKLDAMIPIDNHLTEALDIQKFSMESIMEDDFVSLEDSLASVNTIEEVKQDDTQNNAAGEDNTLSEGMESSPKDSDEDSGIVQATLDQEQKDEDGHSGGPVDAVSSTRAMGTNNESNNRQEQVTPKPGGSTHTEPSGDENDLKMQLLKSSSEKGQQPDEAAITEELSQMSQNYGQNVLYTPNSRVHFEDEVDDTDPRFATPEVPAYNDAEKEIKNRYLKKRRYNVNQKCLTARDKPKSSQLPKQRPRSEDLSYMMSSERSHKGDLELNVRGHDSSWLAEHERKMLENGKDNSLQGVQQVPGILRNGKNFSARKIASETDMRKVGVGKNDDLPEKNSQHSRHFSASSGSSKSECSSNTLVGSQLTLNQNDNKNHNENIEGSYPKISVPSHWKRFRLKKMFQPKKKGHYNPSEVESNYPVDLQSMMQSQYRSMPNLSQPLEEVHHGHHGNVQYRKARQKSGSMGDLLEETRFDEDNLAKSHAMSHSQNLNKSENDIISAQDIQGATRQRASDFQNGFHGNKNSTNQKNDRKTQHMCNEDEIEKLNESFESRGSSASHDMGNGSGVMTAYEAAVNLDQSGLDVDEIIDSDSDNVFSATPVVINKQSKKRKDRNKIPNESTNNGAHQSVNVEAVRNEDHMAGINSHDAVSPTDSISSFTTISSVEGSPIGQRSHDFKGARPRVTSNLQQEKRNNGEPSAGVKGDNSVTTKQNKETPNTNESKHIYAHVNVHHKSDDDYKPETRKNGSNLTRELSISTPDILHLSDNKQPSGSSESNLVKCKELSASKQSLSGRVKKSAKSKFKAIRHAVSMDKGINKAGTEEEQGQQTGKKEKSGFRMPKIKNAPILKNLFGKKKPKQNSDNTVKTRKTSAAADEETGFVQLNSCVSIESLDSPQPGTEVSSFGKLQNVSCDGTQVIQLKKPEHGPLGIFIARGNSQFNHGIFVSRFSEDSKEKKFARLLTVGDEILEINGFVVKDLALDDVYDIMDAKEILTMKILPLIARKDI